MPHSVPNYLVTLPSGDVQAIFPGGVQILAADAGTPPDERQVRWVRQSDGAMVAQLYGYDVPPSGPNAAAVGARIRAVNSYDGTDASLEISHSIFNNRWAARAQAGADGVVIVGEGGISNFLRIQEAGPPKRTITYGSFTMHFPASSQATPVNVPHGLGVVPIAITITPISGPGIAASYFGKDATNFTAQAGYMFGALNGNVNFDFHAIG